MNIMIEENQLRFGKRQLQAKDHTQIYMVLRFGGKVNRRVGRVGEQG